MTFKITCNREKLSIMSLKAFLKLKIVILQHFLCDSRKRRSCSGKTRCIVFDIRCTYMLLKSSLGEFDFADGRRYF